MLHPRLQARLYSQSESLTQLLLRHVAWLPSRVPIPQQDRHGSRRSMAADDIVERDRDTADGGSKRRRMDGKSEGGGGGGGGAGASSSPGQVPSGRGGSNTPDVATAGRRYQSLR